MESQRMMRAAQSEAKREIKDKRIRDAQRREEQQLREQRNRFHEKESKANR